MLPRGKQADQSFRADLRVQPRGQFRPLCRDSPAAAAALAGAAKMTAHGQKGGSRDTTGIRAERDSLDYVRGGANAAAGDDGYPISDAFIAQPLVHSRQRQFNRNADIVANACRRRAGAAAKTVDGDDIRAAAGGLLVNLFYGFLAPVGILSKSAIVFLIFNA